MNGEEEEDDDDGDDDGGSLTVFVYASSISRARGTPPDCSGARASELRGTVFFPA